MKITDLIEGYWYMDPDEWLFKFKQIKNHDKPSLECSMLCNTKKKQT